MGAVNATDPSGKQGFSIQEASANTQANKCSLRCKTATILIVAESRTMLLQNHLASVPVALRNSSYAVLGKLMSHLL